jgi:hypothetical protein
MSAAPRRDRLFSLRDNRRRSNQRSQQERAGDFDGDQVPAKELGAELGHVEL